MILWRHTLKVYGFFVGWDSRECCEFVCSLGCRARFCSKKKKNVYSIFKISAPKTALGRTSAALESCVGSNNPAWVSDPFTVFIIMKLIEGQAECLGLAWLLSSCMFQCFLSWTSTVWNQMLLDLKFCVSKLLLKKIEFQSISGFRFTGEGCSTSTCCLNFVLSCFPLLPCNS